LEVGGGGVFGGGAVDADDGPVLFGEVAGGVAAYEAGDACDEDGFGHGFTPLLLGVENREVLFLLQA
jgi:hypothetical protein